jgi:type IV secretory pathway VirB10-like protein
MPDDRVADRVSADMERIFRGHATADAIPAADRAAAGRSRDFVVHQVPAIRGPSRWVRLVTIGAPLLAIVVVAFLFLQIGSDRRAGAEVAQAESVQRPARNTPVTTPPEPVAYQAAAPVVEEAPAATEQPVSAVTPAPRAEPRAPAPIAADRPTRAAGRAMAAKAAPAAAGDDDCRPGSEENHCIYREVRAADRRLVAAYQAAAEAGVPRREMLAIRRIWTRALAVSLDDPDGTIRTYDDLARRLRDAARVAQADADRT